MNYESVNNLHLSTMPGPLPSIKFGKGYSKNPIVSGVSIIDKKYKFNFNKIMSDEKKNPISFF